MSKTVIMTAIQSCIDLVEISIKNNQDPVENLKQFKNNLSETLEDDKQ